MNLDSLPPHNPEVEGRLIGAALLSNASIDDATLYVSADDFYGDLARVAWREAVAMRDAGMVVDVLTLTDRVSLAHGARFPDVIDSLESWVDRTPDTASAEYHAKIVRQLAIRRRLIDMGHLLIREGHSTIRDSDYLLALADRELASIAEGRVSKEPITLGEAVLGSMERLERRKQGDTSGISTGLTELDAQIGGMRPAQMIVIAARPGHGKTALALNIAERFSSGEGGAVLFFSLEMGGAEIGDRAICGDPLVNSGDFRRGDVDRIGTDTILARYERLKHLPIHIDDAPDRTPTQIAAISRKMKRKHDIRLVIVDYLQLIGNEDASADEFKRVSIASRHLKNLSKSIDAPVIALSQLNRKCEEREDKRPRLSDLRTTGQIEQDADVVMFLYRPELYKPADNPGRAEIIVSKQRDGPCGTVHVLFDASSTRFDDLRKPFP